MVIAVCWDFDCVPLPPVGDSAAAMLRRLFARSLLAQLKEARKAYRELQITSYCGALKAKRSAVRAAVYRELRQSQLQQVCDSVHAFRCTARGANALARVQFPRAWRRLTCVHSW